MHGQCVGVSNNGQGSQQLPVGAASGSASASDSIFIMPYTSQTRLVVDRIFVLTHSRIRCHWRHSQLPPMKVKTTTRVQTQVPLRDFNMQSTN
ncbi:uncharacterized protein DS421_13g409800 [Arachis hypogaea]|nr:uncharacterized protein DS421_13g409800 [Arachis hypogaea]